MVSMPARGPTGLLAPDKCVKAIGPANIQGHCRLIYFSKIFCDIERRCRCTVCGWRGSICEAAGGAAECRLDGPALDNK
jgi:hypothetical protein